MPVYEYACNDHGTFEVVRPISRFREPAPCPECAVPGLRLLSPPNCATMPRSEVMARDRNERSQHEPRVATCSQGHRHCGGHHSRADARDTMTGKPKLQAYTGPRPWVVEHA